MKGCKLTSKAWLALQQADSEELKEGLFHQPQPILKTRALQRKFYYEIRCGHDSRRRLCIPNVVFSSGGNENRFRRKIMLQREFNPEHQITEIVGFPIQFVRDQLTFCFHQR